jgi:uncharacterized membrane protein
LGAAEKLLTTVLMGSNIEKLCEIFVSSCLSGFFLLATKAQKHKFSQKQEFKMQGFSINQPENLAG